MEDTPTPMDVERVPRRQSAAAARAAVADQLVDSDSNSDLDGADGGGFNAKEGLATRNGRAAASQVYGKQATKTRKRSATTTEDARVASKSRQGRSPSLSVGKPLSSISSSARDVSASMPPPPRPRLRPPVSKKPPPPLPPLVVPLSLDGELSDLTSLASSDADRSSPVEFMCIEIPQPVASTSASSPQSRPVTKPGKPATTLPKKKIKEKTWSLAMLRTYVWVLIEPRTWRVYNEEDEEEDGIEGIWWPGKIIGTAKIDAPLKVKLFGPGNKFVLVKEPCEGNVLSKDRGFIPRFRTPTFVSSYLNATSAPRKKQKLDRDEIETRWRAAVEEMKAEDEARRQKDDSDSEDDFPDATNTNMYQYLMAPAPLSTFKSISAPPKISLSTKDTAKTPLTKTKGKRKRRDISEVSADEELGCFGSSAVEERWDEVDDTLDLPGELALGRDGPSKDRPYWPAKLIEYIPPTKPNQAGKYSVTWLDGSVSAIPRSWFYITSEDGFGTCKLGTFESAVVEVQNDTAEDGSLHEEDLERRSPSPIPLDPPPPAADFIQLSVREQFAYTKPVLEALLATAYVPAKGKHDRFMKGGKHRQNVVNEGCLRGRMDPNDVEKLQLCIKRWCFPNERHVDHPVVTAPAPAPAANGHGTESSEQITIEVDADADVVVPSTNLVARREIPVEASLDSIMTESEKKFTSPSPTEGFASSPAVPPSSQPLPDRELKREDSVISNSPHITAASGDGAPPLSPNTTSVATEPQIIAVDDVFDLAAVEKEIEQRQPLSLNRPRGSYDFESLGVVEKIDYCLNILLPEVIRQVLLWRTGARTSIALLSEEQEQKLYEQGEDLLQERDWVMDVMRLRRTLEVLNGKKNTSTMNNGHSRNGSTSGRPRRRNVAMPNYVE
ncbi:hypothetical protein BDN70DRAFT_993562 [Pholiota conissans]|uniref:Uncharacterized protein n=1 Tax=Pholiota conissans TaxID=109636 RepID=A0A9P5Z4F2_9AGAR|nr:hypothetical protein BDN70DRAFT_993562 [Pholiota conissans]